MSTLMRASQGLAPSFTPGVAAVLALALSSACGGSHGDFEGPLRVITGFDYGDTTQLVIKGVATGSRLVRPRSELSIASLDSSAADPLARVRTVVALRDGGAIVYDESYERVARFDADGRFVRQVGRRGSGPGEFTIVQGITALPDDRLVLWDGGGARLNFYESDGTFIGMWMVPSTGLTTEDGLFSEPGGGLFLRALLRFDPADPASSILGMLRWESGGGHDTIPFPRWNDPPPMLHALTPGGVPVSGGAVPYFPRDQHRITADAALVSGPGEPYTFVVLRRGEPPARITRSHESVRVSPAERASLRSRIERAMRGVDPAWSWTGPAIPSVKPAYRGMEVDREGRIWIRISMPTVDAPLQEDAAYDVYAPTGAPIARVELPTGARFAAATARQLWTVRLDSLGVPTVERGRLTLPEPVPLPRARAVRPP